MSETEQGHKELVLGIVWTLWVGGQGGVYLTGRGGEM